MARERPIKTAERTARRIAEDIAEGGYARGDVLSPEAEMIRSYQVSRGTLREALRLLETQGLLVMKAGPNGGATVGWPDPFFLGRIVTLFFRMAGGTYDNVAEMLIVIDPLVARIAATKADAHTPSIIMAALANESHELASEGGITAQTAPHKMSNFHGVLGALSKNPVLAMVSDAIGSIFREHIVATSDASGLFAHSHDDHVRIAEAIVNGDAEEAYARARMHIEGIVEFHRTQVPGVFSQPVQWR